MASSVSTVGNGSYTPQRDPSAGIKRREVTIGDTKYVALDMQVKDEDSVVLGNFVKHKIVHDGKEAYMYIDMSKGKPVTPDPALAPENAGTWAGIMGGIDAGINKFLTNSDKTHTDEANDGSIPWNEKLGHAFKGIKDQIFGMFKTPKKALTTLVVGGIMTGLSIAFPPFGMAMLGVGAIMGGLTLGKGILQSAAAKTDAEERRAWEHIGSGTFTLVGSLIGMKKLSVAQKAKALQAAELKVDAAKAALSKAQGYKNTATQVQKDLAAIIDIKVATRQGKLLNWKKTHPGEFERLSQLPMFKVKMRILKNGEGSVANYITKQDTAIATATKTLQDAQIALSSVMPNAHSFDSKGRIQKALDSTKDTFAAPWKKMNGTDKAILGKATDAVTLDNLKHLQALHKAAVMSPNANASYIRNIEAQMKSIAGGLKTTEATKICDDALALTQGFKNLYKPNIFMPDTQGKGSMLKATMDFTPLGYRSHQYIGHFNQSWVDNGEQTIKAAKDIEDKVEVIGLI